MIKIFNSQFSTLNFILCFSLFTFHFSLANAQSKPDTNLPPEVVKMELQGLWTGPNSTSYFLFKGDSVKEWEDEGADSALKPYCSFTVSRVACDSLSAHVTGASGFFLNVVCGSEDYQQIRCYYILSATGDNLKLGFRGEYDPDSGEFKKVKK